MNPLTKYGIGAAAVAVTLIAFMMMGPLAKIAIMCAIIFVLFVVVPEWRRKRALEQLRENPVEIQWIEVCLPRGFKDANKRMQNFCRKMQASLASGKDDLQNGTGQLHVLTLAHRPENHTRPQLRWLLGCEEKRLKTLERLLGQAFNNMADIRDPDEDIMKAIIAAARREFEADKDDDASELARAAGPQPPQLDE